MLAVVKAWPVEPGACRVPGATASLDDRCARRVPALRPGRRNGRLRPDQETDRTRRSARCAPTAQVPLTKQNCHPSIRSKCYPSIRLDRGAAAPQVLPLPTGTLPNPAELCSNPGCHDGHGAGKPSGRGAWSRKAHGRIGSGIRLCHTGADLVSPARPLDLTHDPKKAAVECAIRIGLPAGPPLSCITA